MKQTEATNLEMASQPKNVTPGERLHFLRKQLLHINQRDFAQQANLSISTYTKLESNKLNYSRITLRKLEKLVMNQDLFPVKASITIANQMRSDGIRLNPETLFGSFAGYDNIEEAMEDPLFYRIVLEITED